MIVATALGVALAAGGAHAAGRSARVVTPAGGPDPTAQLECLEPPAEPVRLDASQTGVLPENCSRARCTSEVWLPGDLADGTCRLAAAVALTIEMPASVRGAFVIRLEHKGERAGSPIEASLLLGDAKGRASIDFPLVTPGSYELSVRRKGEAWACRSSPPMRASGRQRVVVPWRDALIARGRVATAEGVPVAGVALVADTAGALPEERGVFPNRGAVGVWTCAQAGGEPVTSARDGAFALPVDPEVDTLVVAGAWDDPRGVDFIRRRGTGTEPLTLVPRVPWHLTARILDGEDRPVSCRAVLQLDDPDEEWASRALGGTGRESHCSADGRIRLGPSRAAAFELLVKSDEALPSRRRGAGPAGGGTVDLGVVRVDRGAALSLEVRDEASTPVPGARVTAVNNDGVFLRRDAHTDERGRAVVRGLPRESPVDLEVEASGFAPAARAGVAPEGPQIAIRLTRGATLQGHVLTPDRQPVRSFVAMRRAGAKQPRGTYTTENGSFTVESAPGHVELRASAPGFEESEPVSLDLESGHPPDDIELLLRDPKPIRGTVLDPERRPVSGAAVFVVGGNTLFEPPELSSRVTVITGSDGTFVLPAPLDEGELAVARLAGYAAGQARANAGGAARELELRLGHPATLVVKLPGGLSPSARLTLRELTGLNRVIPTRGQRELTIDDMTPGKVLVILDGGPGKLVKLSVEEPTVVDLRAGGRVRGRVTFGGRGVPGAVVAEVEAARGGTLSGGMALTDDDGAYVLPFVQPGQRRIVAQAAQGRAEATISISADAERLVDLELVEARLRVVVTDARTGGRVSGARIAVARGGVECRSFAEWESVQDGVGWRMQAAEDGCAQGVSGSEGIALISLPAPGPHAVEITATRYERWSKTLDVVEGVAEVRAALTPGGPPLVRVLLETENPGVAGSLYCIQGGGSASHGPVSVEDVCEGLKPGPAEVAFRAASYGGERAAVVVPEEGEVTVTLKVARGGRLEVWLPDPSRRVVAVLDSSGMAWSQAPGLGWPVCSHSRNDGGPPRYGCDGLPPGPYTIEFDDRTHATALIRSGETTIVP